MSCSSLSCPEPTGFFSSPPSIGGNTIIASLFLLLTSLCLITGLRNRTYSYSLLLVLGCALQTMAFAARLVLRTALASQAWFAVWETCSLLGPAALTLAGFLVLPHLMMMAGERQGPVGVRHVGYMFMMLQCAVGVLLLVGALRMALVTQGETKSRDISSLMAGLAVQIASLVVFLASQVWFILDLYTDFEIASSVQMQSFRSVKFKRVLANLQLTSTLLLCVFILRTVEISSGLTSRLAQSDSAAIVISGIVPLLVGFLLAVISPSGALDQPTWLSTSPYRRRRSSRPADIMVIRSPLSPLSAPTGYTDSSSAGLPGASPYGWPSATTGHASYPQTPNTPHMQQHLVDTHADNDDDDDDNACCVPFSWLFHCSSRRRAAEKRRRSMAALNSPRSPEGIPYKFYDPSIAAGRKFSGNRSPVLPQMVGAPLSKTGNPRDGPAPAIARPRQTRVSGPPTRMVNDDELW